MLYDIPKDAVKAKTKLPIYITRGAITNKKKGARLTVVAECNGYNREAALHKYSKMIDRLVPIYAKLLGIRSTGIQILLKTYRSNAMRADATSDGKNHLIRLNVESNFPCLMEILAHEMVHVKQYKKKELCYLSNRDVWTWKGQAAVMFDSDENYDEYVNSPWEREAWGIQEELATKAYHIYKARYGSAEDLMFV